MKMPCIICDIDGVLSDHSHRIKYAHRKEWPTYHALGTDDPPILPIIELISIMISNSITIFYSTGREELYREQTEKWLDQHGLTIYHEQQIMMRTNGDKRPSRSIKKDHLSIIKEIYDVWFAIDDMTSVKKMYFEEGVMCLQPHELEWDEGMEIAEKEDNSIPAIFNKQAQTFLKKQEEYGESYLQHGKILASLFPDGLTLNGEEDFVRMGLLNAQVVKLNRYCNNFPLSTHIDSLHDLSIYTTMLESVDRRFKRGK